MALGNKKESEAVNALLQISVSGPLNRAQESNHNSCDKHKDRLEDTACYTPKVASITFPMKLMNMINWYENQEETKSIKSPIRWMPDGDGFVVKDPVGLKSHALPRFFKSVKFESFIRKLYRWGFKRMNAENGENIYRAQNFHRNWPNLCLSLRVQYSAKELKQQKKCSKKEKTQNHTNPSLNDEMSLTESICTGKKAIRHLTPFEIINQDNIQKGAERLLAALNFQVSPCVNFRQSPWLCHMIPYLSLQVNPSLPTFDTLQGCSSAVKPNGLTERNMSVLLDILLRAMSHNGAT